VDLLPTLVDFAAGGSPPQWVEPIDGRSLAPLVATGDEPGEPEAFSEYTAEGVTGPCCMLRAGQYKYVYTHGHPDQLFDMQEDPNELVNIAQRRPQVLANLKSRVFDRWDPETIKTEVIKSQARRKFINALPDALQPVWDYQANVDDTKRFVRRGSARVIKVKKRWPPVASPSTLK
jgi:choline-sulfatase